MKRYIKLFLYVLVGAQVITACDKDFLDEEILDEYAPSNLTDLAGMEASLNGLYNRTANFQAQADRQGWLAAWQVGTDVIWPAEVQGIEVPYFNYELLNPLDEVAGRTWNWNYEMINNANIIIANVENPELEGVSQANKSRINAEARFFRAYTYNFLATVFGGVPLITEPLTAPKTDFVRASLEDINNQIKIDLDSATTYLPVIGEAPHIGRANVYMAHQLAAEFYLRTGEYAKAESHADMIISSGAFELVSERYGVKAGDPGDPFSDMFHVGNQRYNQGNTEAIWVLETENPSDVPSGNAGDFQHRRVWGAGYHNVPGLIPADSLGGRGLSRIRLNNWVLHDLYEEGDMRNSEYSIKREFYFNNPDPKFANIYGTKVTLGEHTLADGTKIQITPVDTIRRINPYTMKWGHFDPRDVFGWGTWKDIIMMRLGETYLLRAEAEVMQDKPGEAAATINELREARNAPSVDAADMNLDFILDERARELIGEENRRLTLMRTKTLVDRVNRLNSYSSLPEGLRVITGLEDKHLLLPIPDQEIRLNKDAELKQNPGYN